MPDIRLTKVDQVLQWLREEGKKALLDFKMVQARDCAKTFVTTMAFIDDKSLDDANVSQKASQLLEKWDEELREESAERVEAKVQEFMNRNKGEK